MIIRGVAGMVGGYIHSSESAVSAAVVGGEQGGTTWTDPAEKEVKAVRSRGVLNDERGKSTAVDDSRQGVAGE